MPDQAATVSMAMMANGTAGSSPRQVLIAGGGVAALEAMLALRHLAGDRVSLALVAPDPDFVYQPLSTGEPFALAEVTAYPLAQLARDHGAELIEDSVVSVDGQQGMVKTQSGRELAFDELIVALGASRDTAFADALTFHDQRDTPGYRELLEQLAAGRIRRLGFLVPSGVVWPFPLYELALLTAHFAAERGLDVELFLVSDGAPLALFGEEASQAMRAMLDARGVKLYTGNQARVTAPSRALLTPDGEMVHADRFVSLPRLTGPRLPGLPHNPDGFIPTDDLGRVVGMGHVYAAGDCTTFLLKQGGLAAQQADAVATAIAAEAGADVQPAPFQPVMRGMLLTGGGPRYLRAESIGGGSGAAVADHALWWPPTKIAGRYLAPALGALDADAELETLGARAGALSVERAVPRSGAAAATPDAELWDFPPHGHGL